MPPMYWSTGSQASTASRVTGAAARGEQKRAKYQELSTKVSQVSVSRRADGGRGWIPAARATLDATDYAIRIDRSARRLTLHRGDRRLRRFSVAVGRPANPTPLGRYAVTDRLRTGRADSPYGCCAVALTGHQTKLVPGWPGGDRLAIHGTPQPESVGRAVSLGCLRAREPDIRALIDRVPLGTPVIVEA